MDKVMRLASKKGVLIFSEKPSCCLSYTIYILLKELMVDPEIVVLEQEPDGREMEKAIGCTPAVFIGGTFRGSTNDIMSLHLQGKLIPLLKPFQHECNSLQG